MPEWSPGACIGLVLVQIHPEYSTSQQQAVNQVLFRTELISGSDQRRWCSIMFHYQSVSSHKISIILILYHFSSLSLLEMTISLFFLFLYTVGFSAYIHNIEKVPYQINPFFFNLSITSANRLNVLIRLRHFICSCIRENHAQRKAMKSSVGEKTGGGIRLTPHFVRYYP